MPAALSSTRTLLALPSASPITCMSLCFDSSPSPVLLACHEDRGVSAVSLSVTRGAAGGWAARGSAARSCRLDSGAPLTCLAISPLPGNPRSTVGGEAGRAGLSVSQLRLSPAAEPLAACGARWQRCDGDEVAWAAWSPDGAMLAFADDDGSIVVVAADADGAPGKVLAHARRAHASIASCVAWLPLLASLSSEEMAAEPAGGAGSRRGCLTRFLLSAGFDNRVVLWEVAVSLAADGVAKAARLVEVRRWNSAARFATAPSPVSPSMRGSLRGGAAAAPTPLEVIGGGGGGDGDGGGGGGGGVSRLVNPPFVYSVAWVGPPASAAAPLDTAFAAATGDGCISVVHADSGRLLARWSAHASAATCLATAPPGWVAGARTDGSVHAASLVAGHGCAQDRPMRLFSAGNDRGVCLWEVGAAAAAARDGDLAEEEDRPAAAPPLPLTARRLWAEKHSRGGINSIGAAAVPAAAGEEGGTAGELAACVLAVADVTAKPTLYAFDFGGK